MVTLELSEVVMYGLDVVTQVVQALQHQATFIAGLGLVLWWHLKSWQMVAQLDTTYHVFLCTIDLYNVVSSTLIANPPYFLDFTEVYIVRGDLPWWHRLDSCFCRGSPGFCPEKKGFWSAAF